VFALSVAAYAMAYASWRRGNPRMAVAWLLGAGFCLRLYAAGDAFLHAWDERFHALVAKNLIAHPLRPTLYDAPVLPYDARDWFANHVWLHKPPFPLWLMAASMAVFGVNELALRLPSLLLSTAAIYATYRMGVLWKGTGVGLLAGYFQSVNALLVLLAAGWWATDHPDTGLISVVGLAVAVAAVRGPGPAGFASLGALSGLAVLSKSLPGLLPLPVGLAWHWSRAGRRTLLARGALALAVCLAVALPWMVYTAHSFPVESALEQEYTLRHLVEPLEGHRGSVFYYLRRMPGMFGELIYIPLAWFFWRLARGERGPAERALALWVLLPFGVFSLSASKMPGYVMVAAPAVFLIQAACCAWLRERWDGGRGRRIVVALVLFGLLVLPVRILLDGLRVFRPHDRRPAWAEDLRQLGTRLAGSRAVVFGTPRPIETMFYTSQTAYPSAPDRATVESLQARGYRVLVCDTPDLPPDRRGWAGVEYLTAGCSGP
jgi:4-amino-4-deoxy-L-arabinose transferase-like glycosyltransferase